MSFYGIFIPINNDNDRENHYVFTDKQEAFQLLKTHKEARLKEFKTNEEAVNFSKNGMAVLPINTTMSSSPSTVHDKSPFRGPKTQELVAFRKSIEQGKLDVVRETIWNNPRYLIGSGDTPTILKESTRYNALHVAALAKNGKMCELILKTISDPLYIELVHNNKHNGHICEEIAKILLDLYLNMPEKGRNETPLHLAVKFGCVEAVEVLTSYAQCSYTANSDGKYPKDTFRKRWKTPPRLGRPISPSRSPIASTPDRKNPLIFPRKLFSFNEPSSNTTSSVNNNFAVPDTADSHNNIHSNDNDAARTIDGNSNNGHNSFLLDENDSQTQENSNKLDNGHQWRSSPDDSDDDDDFFSDAENSDDENDIFYTPPSSPSQLIEDYDNESDQSIVPDSYSTYLLGDEPTKTDMHVLNAIKTIEIDKLTYPCIHQWKSALQQHSQEEIENFPSPCVVVKGRQTSDLSVRKLFQSPMKFQLSPVKKTVRFSNFFKSKSLNFSSDYSPDSDTSPLARMMVSPFECTSPSSPSSTDSGAWK
ncbi:hypothetical protein HA402_013784 [Bradysia odoriphaga]|nr:hypothetical protein HA402_013784 [Bradysia odoriphaga]